MASSSSLVFFIRKNIVALIETSNFIQKNIHSAQYFFPLIFYFLEKEISLIFLVSHYKLTYKHLFSSGSYYSPGKFLFGIAKFCNPLFVNDKLGLPMPLTNWAHIDSGKLNRKHIRCKLISSCKLQSEPPDQNLRDIEDWVILKLTARPWIE